MGELDERWWAVLSERGCEAAALSYAEAAELIHKLTGEKISGLYVITNEAANRLTQKSGVENKTVARPPEAKTEH